MKPEEKIKDIDKKVNEAIKQLKFNEEKNVWEFPDGLDLEPEVAYAVKVEKRRRDAQAALTKAQQLLKEKEIENEELKKFVLKAAKLDLTPEQREELEELKEEDPEKWRQRINQLEEEARTKSAQQVEEITMTAKQKAELEKRKVLLDAFLEDHPEITKEDLTEKIPVGLHNKLEKGEISFSQYLHEAYEFISSGRKIADVKTPDVPNLDEVGGSSEDLSGKDDKLSASDYKNTIF